MDIGLNGTAVSANQCPHPANSGMSAPRRKAINDGCPLDSFSSTMAAMLENFALAARLAEPMDDQGPPQLTASLLCDR